ncbi:YbhB/YbcL family Raf kinase inhibitor-like protein [Spirillospora sp. NPDC049652]
MNSLSPKRRSHMSDDAGPRPNDNARLGTPAGAGLGAPAGTGLGTNAGAGSRADASARRSPRRGRRLAAAASVAAVAVGLSGCGLIGQPQNKSAELSEWFTVTSPVFRDGGDLPARYACATYSGSAALGKTPPLRWSAGGVRTAQSYAIVVDDPDAAGGTNVHWVVAGIDQAQHELVEGGRLGTMVEARNTAKKVGYTPPCPPKGARHRYRFTVYALDTRVPFANGATLKDALGDIAKHTVGRGRITGNFGDK